MDTEQEPLRSGFGFETTAEKIVTADSILDYSFQKEYKLLLEV